MKVGSSVGYGCGGDEAAAFVHRRVETPASSASSASLTASLTAKRLLAVAGTVLVVGSATVAFVEMRSDGATSVRADAMTFEASHTQDASELLPEDWLMQGLAFQLRSAEQQLCMDDGGGTSSGTSKFVLEPCDPSSPNQVFTYDAETQQMRSVGKPSLCVDDGGGWHNGQTKFHLWDCNAEDINQKFIYVADTQQFQSMYKNNKCMDDGGGEYTGRPEFYLWQCDDHMAYQRFEIVPFVPDVPQQPTSYLVPDYLRHGARIVIVVNDKPGLCVDDGGGWGNGHTKFRDGHCNGNSESQVFVFDEDHAMFRSALKPDMCLDDGGSHFAGETQFHLWGCDVDNINQRFLYEEATQHIRNPVKDLCMDSADGVYTVQQCASSSSQAFSIRSASEVAGAPDIALPDYPPVDHPLLATMEEFMMRVPGKANLCVDDGGGRINGETKFRLWTCDPSDLNQVFRYDPTTYLIHSAVKGGMCVDDGGGLSNGETKFHLWECDAQNMNQKFVYDWSSERFYNPNKPNMCMDDGHSFSAGDTQMHLWQCDVTNRNQHFELVARTAVGDLVPPPVEMPDEQEETEGRGGIPPLDVLYPDETTVSRDHTETEDPLLVVDLGDISDDDTGTASEPTEPMMPMSLDEPEGEQANPVDPANPHPTFEDSMFDEGDWNLLAPARQTISSVNLEDMDDITSDEIFTYLLGVQAEAETAYVKIISKVRRTSECVSRGLQSLGKSAVALDEYDTLVKWMYENCIIDASTPEPMEPTENEETSSDELPSDETTRVYMTKLEFYQRIKDHFAHEHEALVGSAESVRLGSDIAMAKQQKLLACSYEASNRFGREKEYELHEHFHNAIQWMTNECLTSASNTDPIELTDNGETSPDMLPASIDDAPEYMTKLQFYHRIKDHFAREYGELFGETESVHVRSHIATDKLQKLLECSYEASNRFGREKEYELDEHFHNAVEWISNDCLTSPVDTEHIEPTDNGEMTPDILPTSIDGTPEYMTKLEFYHRIKDHFANEHGELVGSTESVRLRSEGAAAKRQELMRCIDEASSRFGREKEYEQPEHFHSALQWINNECLTATP